jgi:hypothetical protein
VRLLGAALVVNFGSLAMIRENPLGPSSFKSVEPEMTTKAVPNYRTPKAVAISSKLSVFNFNLHALL